jgi:hypothetical protein
VLPHCWYTVPPTFTGTHPGGGVATIEPMTTAVAVTAAAAATG